MLHVHVRKKHTDIGPPTHDVPLKAVPAVAGAASSAVRCLTLAPEPLTPPPRALILPRRGFGVVRFGSKEDAEAACAKLNNTQVEGRTISVRIDRFA